MKNIEDSAGFPDELLARRIEYLSGFMTAERYATLCRAVSLDTAPGFPHCATKKGRRYNR